jgi:uncharacterized protein GlcG (DUF336 family)
MSGELAQSRLDLTVAGASVVIEACQVAAGDLGVEVCVVAVDRAGDTVVALRMDGAARMAFAPATAKARSAARLGRPTGPLPELLGVRLSIASEAEFTDLAGGVPLRISDQVVGAVGVGGASPDQDVAIATAGAEALAAASESR